jgi:hypothetical protein
MELPLSSTPEWRLKAAESAAQLGGWALQLRANLDSSEPPADYRHDGTKGYAPGDRGTLGQTIDFLGMCGSDDRADYMTYNARTRLRELVYAFHVSLPFDEAERAWLDVTNAEELDAYEADFFELQDRLGGGLVPPKEVEAELVGRHPLDRVLRRSGVILSAGLMKPVSGQGLFERWSQWRHDAGPFEGQHGVQRTQQHLQDLASFSPLSYPR